MKQVLFKKGSAIVEDVPVPNYNDEEVLVKVESSCLSAGTEMAGIRGTGVPLWKKVIQQPSKAISVIKSSSENGFNHTWEIIKEKVDKVSPTGYSASGIVVSVGSNVEDLIVGDRVACAGDQSAYHAEYICVPRNLCVLLPDKLDHDIASTVTLGAIALQGVRRATPTLGETFAVIGLGLIGQLTVQLLKANGCQIIGLDLNTDKVKLARELGLTYGLSSNTEDHLKEVAKITHGFGVDGVIITASSASSDSIISTAFKMCRKKGRVVLVGDVGLNLDRGDFYKKEIDFFISTSYGPGRYDKSYEEHGIDYPFSYVRWTENRNMQEYLRLLDHKVLHIEKLITSKFSILNAIEAYSALRKEGNNELIILLKYPESQKLNKKTISFNLKIKKKLGAINLGLIGAGSFAKNVHLPNLKQLNKYFNVQSVVTNKGHNAVSIAKRYNIKNATTDYLEVLSDKSIDAVLITTRHNLHYKMVKESLKAGKHVFVEKPLLLSLKELDDLDKLIVDFKSKKISLPILFTGYNRRHSYFAKKLKNVISNQDSPFILNYKMNAGYIPYDHWIHTAEGGGRNLGEACHIYDLFIYLTDSSVSTISVNAILSNNKHYKKNDNFIVTITFKNGSICSLTYTSLGSNNFPKETAEIYCNGKIGIFNDYRKLDIFSTKNKSYKKPKQDKGYKSELVRFVTDINNGVWSTSWRDQKQTLEIALFVESKLKSS